MDHCDGLPAVQPQLPAVEPAISQSVGLDACSILLEEQLFPALGAVAELSEGFRRVIAREDLESLQYRLGLSGLHP